MLFLISPLILLFFAVYTSYRIFSQLSIPRLLKILASLLLIFGAESMLLIRFLSTTLTPMPFPVLRISGMLTVLMMVLFFVVVLRDVVLFIGYLVRRFILHRKIVWLNKLASPRSSAILFIVTSILVVVGVWQAYKVPEIKNVTITIPNLAPELKGLTIVQLSDLHVGSSFDGKWLKQVVDKANEAKPDIIMITGDIVDGAPDILRPELEPLDELNAPLGVFYSYGNHDYYSGLEIWLKEHADQGRKFLINENVILNHNNTPIAIVGFPDSGHIKNNGLERFDYPKALANIPPNTLTIAMAHQPAALIESANYKIDLQLSGHTHGGQLYPAFPVVNMANKGYRSGLYKLNNTQLYVSNGTGLWGNMPIRLGAQSEITVIILE